MKAQTTKSALLTSAMALLLCFAMLLGTTFAWFTDTASTGVNKIQAGNLDVQLLDTAGNSIEGQRLEFKKADGAQPGEKVLWEPGCTYELPAFVVKNNGSLTLKYKIVLSGIDGDAKLNEAIDWTMNGAAVGTEYTLGPGDTSAAITIKGHMDENAGNEYQGLSIDGIAITVYATQKDAEFDSFNNSYDAGATYPVEIIPAVQNQSLAAVKDDNGTITEYKYANSDNTFVATVPAGAVENGATPVVTAVKTDVPANITINAAEKDAISYDISVTGTNVTVSDTNPATITLNVGKGLTGVEVYHNNTLMNKDENGTLAVGEYKYDENAGTVTFMTSSFSPFTVVLDSPVAVAAGVRYYNLQEALNAGGEVILLKDITGSVNSANKKAFTIAQNVTLNGNGKTIKVSGDSTGDTFAMYITAPGVTIKNVTLETSNLERAIRFQGEGGGKIQDAKITSSGVGIHVKGTSNVDIKNTIIEVNAASAYSAHLRTGVMVGSEAVVTLTDSTVQVSAADKVEGNTNTWGKGLYVGNGAKGTLIVNNSKVTADFALAIDGSSDTNNLNNITVNSGMFDGAYGSPSGYSYKELVINGGTFKNFASAANGFYDKDDVIARLEISGGTFDTAPDAKFIADGKGTVQNGDWYEVISGTFVSTEEELKTALNGTDSTIYLASNIALTSSVTLSRSVTLDGCGHAISYSGTGYGFQTSNTNNIIVKNCVFEKPANNWANTVVGGITYQNCTFNGGCVYVTPSETDPTITIEGCTFNGAMLTIDFMNTSKKVSGVDTNIDGTLNAVLKNNTFNVTTPFNVNAMHTGVGLVFFIRDDSGFYTNENSKVNLTVENNTFNNQTGTGSFCAYQIIETWTGALTEASTIPAISGLNSGNTFEAGAVYSWANYNPWAGWSKTVA